MSPSIAKEIFPNFPWGKIVQVEKAMVQCFSANFTAFKPDFLVSGENNTLTLCQRKKRYKLSGKHFGTEY
jgi:hypothetical protein